MSSDRSRTQWSCCARRCGGGEREKTRRRRPKHTARFSHPCPYGAAADSCIPIVVYRELYTESCIPTPPRVVIYLLVCIRVCVHVCIPTRSPTAGLSLSLPGGGPTRAPAPPAHCLSPRSSEHAHDGCARTRTDCWWRPPLANRTARRLQGRARTAPLLAGVSYVCVCVDVFEREIE